MINKASKGLLVLATLVALAGCQYHSDAVQNGKPVAAGGQAAPGGSLGHGPAGGPQN
ncbi:hypothetical protein [Tatumella saanichensis]|uniref:hypothetical protein n=1 Tax=Tatumella saanichensis TaxID=480813 RepID=UPI0004B9B63A|nr:hypothetical protein [Tatumella saanichensis]